MSLELPYYGNFLSCEIESQDFLGRTTYTVSLGSPRFSESPDVIQGVLSSPGQITIFDADFPTSLQANLGRVRFHIGRNPDFPFQLSFTVPGELKGTLSFTTVYYSPLYDMEMNREKYDMNYSLSVSMSVPIGEE